MVHASDPNVMLGNLAICGLVLACLWRLAVLIRNAPVTPDPWDAETDHKLSEPDAEEVCPHCLTPQPPTARFCEHCGRAVGPYNNWMPYVCVSSEGEVFRNGTSGEVRRSPLTITGYLLSSIGCYSFLAPIYWFCLFSKLNRPRSEAQSEHPQKT